MFESSQIKSKPTSPPKKKEKEKKTKNSKIKAPLKDAGWKIVSRGRKKGKDESDSWQNVCPDSLSAVADEYGCQLFRANCYSPSARSVNQRDWRRVAALRVARGVPRFPRVVPPLLFSSLSPRELFNRPGKQLYPFDRVNCTQTHDWRQGSWKGWWVESLARTKPPFRMYVRSGSRVCCLFVWSLSIICGFRVTLLKPTHCFLLIIINSLTCYFLG